MPEALLINDTSWSGFAAEDLRYRAVVEVDTINKGVCTVKSDIRKQYTLPRVEITDFMQKRSATPVSKGSITVDGVQIAPKDLMFYCELNPRDFESHYFAEYLQARLLDRALPANAEAGIMAIVVKRLNEFFENAYWRSRIQFDPEGDAVTPSSKGDTGADALDSNGLAKFIYFDGFLKRLLADANTIQAPSPVALTAANIYGKMTGAYQQVPHALLTKYGPLGLKCITGYDTQRIYEDALTTAQFKNNDYTEKGINRYKGYDLVACAGVPSDTFLFSIANPETVENNLYVGVNSAEDNTLKFGQVANFSELWGIKGLFKIDTQVQFTDQTVLYTTEIN
jgi:hypothetical protein